MLLYILGKAAAEDLAKGLPAQDVGWVTDDEAQSGIWGRGGDDNKLHVLIHRLRQELKKSGFDPWFIEKRHRYIRVRAADVKVR